MGDRQWALVVSADQYAAERLYPAEHIHLTERAGEVPAPGDPVAVIAGTDPQVLFGLVRTSSDDTAFAGRYEARFLHDPPALATRFPIGFTELTADEYDRLAGGALTTVPEPLPVSTSVPMSTSESVPLLGPASPSMPLPLPGLVPGSVPPEPVPGPVSQWLVSVALPIEAHSPAEAVREFWSYVNSLGPGELPAYVSPVSDELAMQTFVHGAEANQDPEEP